MISLLSILLGAFAPQALASESVVQALGEDPEVAWFDATTMLWRAGELSRLPQGTEFVLQGQHYEASGGGGVAWLGEAPLPWELYQADHLGAALWELERAPVPRSEDWVYALVQGRHQPLAEVAPGELVSYAGKVWLVDGPVLRETGMALHRVEETHRRAPTATIEMTVQGPGGLGSFVGADHPFYLPEEGVYRDMARIGPGEALWALGEDVEVVGVAWTGEVQSLYNLTIGADAHDFVVWGEPGLVLSHNCGKTTRAQRDAIETLRSGGEVTVKSADEARALLREMPELRPATQERLMPNPSGRMSGGFADPPGTFRGDLINKQAPWGPVHPGVNNLNHANYPHYNIKLPNKNKAAIIIKSDG